MVHGNLLSNAINSNQQILLNSRIKFLEVLAQQSLLTFDLHCLNCYLLCTYTHVNVVM
ncbi:unnamed protein product [Schistosoma mattheei]|uniref:Uncharacterized protein n=1 Tax=Schistosoma mattheei TaxID=31246 RepID=A0A183PAJ6_9TREM|nr:unnamed protein product [Schistosoma mattheei]